MPDEPIIVTPATFLTQQALAFGALGDAATAVDATHPLPTARIVTASGVAPLAGSTSASTTAGPFTPQLSRAINLTLAGTWAGSVQLLRSTDGGVTKLPVTAAGAAWALFTANCNEPVAEESEAGATYYLGVTLTSGTLTYRVAQ